MARPTDPDKLAALRARQAANSRAYRARKAGQAPATPGTGDAPPPPRQAPSSEAAVLRAHEQRTEAQKRRNAVVGGLPSAHNPAVNIHTPRDMPTAPAPVIPDTASRRRQRIKVLRENTEAQKLSNIGRARKQYVADFMTRDARAESIRENMTKAGIDHDRLHSALARIGKASQQTVGIFFRYEGGEGDLESALTQLAYPEDSDVEDALGRIEMLADRIERAESLYGPAALKGTPMGGKTGRLRL